MAEEQTVILVRHARTVPDPGVEAESWQLAGSAGVECRRLAEELAAHRPNRVITSTHHKCIATGTLLAEHLGLPLLTAEGLEEHDRSGIPFMADPEEWLSTLRSVFDRPDEVVLGIESANDALARIEVAVRRLLAEHPGERLVISTHATVMALFVAAHNEVDAFEFWQTIEMPEALVLQLPGFSLVERLSGGGVSNAAFNRP